MELKVDLGKTGWLGLNEELRCKGFQVNIDVNSVITSIDFHYSLCVKGLDGTLIETSIHNKTFSNENLRSVLDENGNQVYEDVQGEQIFDSDGLPVLDLEGNPTYNIISKPVTIGVIDFWLATIGENYIIPDLQVTLNAISQLYI